MNNNHDLFLKKPVKIWNRELSISPRSFLSSLGKAAFSGASLDAQGVAENLIDAVAGISPEQKASHAAWLLVYRSLMSTLSDLVKEYEDFFPKKDNSFNPDFDHLAYQLEQAIDDIDVGFNSDFFDRPHDFPLLDHIRIPLTDWLASLGMVAADAQGFYFRLKVVFVLSLHKEWIKNSTEYACIEQSLISPFTKATKIQRSWMQYGAWLQEQANARMFAEAFSLSQVYVPPRAYYEKRDGGTEEKILEHNRSERIVVDLHVEIERWVRDFDYNLPVRIISGGPGSGKSSFARIFSAYIAREIKDVNVLYVPLHHFDLSADLVAAVEQFTKEDRYLIGSPLDASEGAERLLIIFDGLDELSMQGKSASEIAYYFVDEVITKIEKFNAQKFKRQVLITGRDVAVQSTASRLRGDRQILHVLPYFISEGEREEYVDEENLLQDDQRNTWWKNYGCAKGLPYNSIPEDLNISRLAPITREPLLNYLVALSYERKQISFSNDTTLNVIYQDLLDAVHERQWDHGSHAGAKHLKNTEFIRILEEVALAVWHGDGRTATINQIYERCRHGNLTRYLEAFQEGAQKGVSRLLAAFYFRQSDRMFEGDKTFEFTHKSFGEYLIARRIVRAVKQICSELIRHADDPDTGYDEREALKRWVEICGITPMDEYIYQFLFDEISAHDDELLEWQSRFSSLIGYAIRHGVPMEQIGSLRFSEMMRYSRNAEEMLMVVHSVCAKKNRVVSNIDWGSNISFGEWLRRIHGQRDSPRNERLILGCLNGLNLDDTQLVLQDLYKANASMSTFKNSHFSLALSLFSDFQESDLRGSRLDSANFRGSNFKGANLSGTNFREANLEEVNFEAANLKGVKFEDANLEKVSFKGANLEDANLLGANLKGALFEGAILKGAKLDGEGMTLAVAGGANVSAVIKTKVEKRKGIKHSSQKS